MKRTLLPIVMIAGLLVGCAGNSQPSPTVTVTEPGPTVTVTAEPEAEPSPEQPQKPTENYGFNFPAYKIGETGSFLGITLTIKSVDVLKELPTTDGSPIKAADGEQFILVKSHFKNDTDDLIDLSCSGFWDVYMQGWDTEDREMSPLFEDNRFPGNPECNKDLLQGQSHDWTFAYRTVEGAKPSYISLKELTTGDDAIVLLLADPEQL